MTTNLRWQPGATLANLTLRANILRLIRDFFHQKKVLEVETPLLNNHTVTDPYIHSIPAFLQAQGKEHCFYLQTSPEYAMKRFLCAYNQPIFQICKAFRQDEIGRLHHPEFTILEWYRPGFNHHDLMDEVDELLQLILKTSSAKRKTYAELFEISLNINPHHATLAELKNCAAMHNIKMEGELENKDAWLQLLLSHCIEPTLGIDSPCFIYDFPITQAALAKIINSDTPVAARFEVYVKGIELANGFHELQDAKEQRLRFEKNKMERKRLQLPELSIDENFLQALNAGLPDCSGVALGVDRLIMLALQAKHISDVISFDFGDIN